LDLKNGPATHRQLAENVTHYCDLTVKADADVGWLHISVSFRILEYISCTIQQRKARYSQRPTAYVVHAGNIITTSEGFLLMLSACCSSVSLNEEYSGKCQPVLPTKRISFPSLDDSKKEKVKMSL
jgi:hypothetical protein